MAITQETFNGNGSNLGPFSFTFKWLRPSDIKVSVGGVLKTAGTHYNLQSLNYTTKTGGQVLFTAGNAPPVGTGNIRVYRETDDSSLVATFSSGSAIRAADLNSNFTQTLYVTQETVNNSNTAVSSISAATTAANTAVSTANSALSTANTALTNSSNAVSTANSAVSTANSAVSTANSAVATANTASTSATNAVNTSNAALSAVSEVLNYTTVANVAAIPASPVNGDAVRVTNSTGIQSFTPLTGIPGGFVGSSALTVEIYYDGPASTWRWSRYFPVDPEGRYAPKASPTFTGTVTIPAGASISGYLTTANAASTYAPLASPTFTGSPYINGSYQGNVVAVAVLNIDCSLGNYFTKTINGASTFTVSNVPSSRAYSFTLELTHTSGAITWFTGVEWPSGTAPTLTTGKTHLFMFVTDDGGSRWRASSLINYTN